MKRFIALGAAATMALAPLCVPVSADAATATVPRFRNCTELNKKFPHGVGKRTARDKVSGKAKPVTTFTRNDKIYAANVARDGDRDGIACEKR